MNILSLILFFTYLTLVASMETCLDSVCQIKEPIIRFPFQIEGKQEKTCGYPGFKVSCSEKGQTLLKLPNSRELSIQRINYAAQQLWVNDPNNCIPKRLLSLNLSGSPFDAVYYQEFTFFNCSLNLEYLMYRYKPIACLSDASKYAVFATPSQSVFAHLSSICDLVDTVKVPVQSPLSEHVLSSDLADDLRLSWDSPPCGRCESHGDRCGFENNNTFELHCSKVPSKGFSRSASYALAICIGTPVFLCFIAVVSCICSRYGIGTHGWASANGSVPDFEPLIGPERTNISGLDGPTIESYPKIVIGESRCLPKPDDKTCPICLSEYIPKETVKTIPECGHCFHSQCIDEWLPLNASCPICRTSPPKLP
ncbi:putative RING-H2 finger protein ATL21A [Gastrolobium bilobum]|uniref:putative RING-H2 finger protein ATL21A n=1 Tax=Gastrolobium bilobum TaxID=150636 RepID=UPI002AB08684|nr:putative RING-H2 finger protein ATL21A [Gastrolobium bilobum]